MVSRISRVSRVSRVQLPALCRDTVAAVVEVRLGDERRATKARPADL
jgi:hypothetical protein